MKNRNTTTYAENYKQLEEINDKLQKEQSDPSIIDQLAPMLEKASKSYIICKERIEAAKKFIADFEKNLDNEN